MKFYSFRSFVNHPGRWLRITVFLGVTSPYTAVYDEIRHENSPYSAVILVTIIWHHIQHRILCRIRSYACRILITNGRKTPAWITVKIRCVNGPYLTVYGGISPVFFDQGNRLKIYQRSILIPTSIYQFTYKIKENLFSKYEIRSFLIKWKHILSYQQICSTNLTPKNLLSYPIVLH